MTAISTPTRSIVPRSTPSRVLARSRPSPAAEAADRSLPACNLQPSLDHRTSNLRSQPLDPKPQISTHLLRHLRPKMSVSFRDAYTTHGVDNYYTLVANTYKNPHEPGVQKALRQILESIVPGKSCPARPLPPAQPPPPALPSLT